MTNLFFGQQQNVRMSPWKVPHAALKQKICRLFMAFFVISGLSGSTFSTLYYKRHNFLKKILLKIKCILWFSQQLLAETLLILRIIKRGIVVNVHRSPCNPCPILIKVEFSQ